MNQVKDSLESLNLENFRKSLENLKNIGCKSDESIELWNIFSTFSSCNNLSKEWKSILLEAREFALNIFENSIRKPWDEQSKKKKTSY